MKNYFKYAIYKFRLAKWLDMLLYNFSKLKNRRANTIFRRQNPGAAIPPDYFLYETYQVDYRKFIEDGQIAATEIAAWSAPYLVKSPAEILDWGCGGARITRHLPKLFPASIIHGCDTNADMIEWDKEHFPGILFSLSSHQPPISYADSQFGLINGFSVLTHIDATLQETWISELHRVLQQNGVLIITTHGSAYIYQLTGAEKKQLQSAPAYTRIFGKQGHRMVSTYHNAILFRQMLEKYFTVMEFHDGKSNPEKIGGQDIWILAKKR